MKHDLINKQKRLQLCINMTKQKNELNIDQKKDYAKILFVYEKLNQKETAQKTGVTEKTIGKWVVAGKWDELRITLFLSKAEELKRLQQQLKNLNDVIMERDIKKRFPDSKEADILSKLAAAIKSLETQTNVGDVVNVFIDFNAFIRQAGSIKEAQLVFEWQDKYIKSLMK